MPKARQPWLHDLVTVLSAPTAVLSEAGGQIRAGGAQGVLHADTRVLSTAVLEVAGAEPAAVSGGPLDAGRARFTAVPRSLGDDIPDPTVWVEREREVTPGRVAERIRLVCAADAGVDTELVLRVDADLAGISQIKAGRADGTGAVIEDGPAGGRPAGAGADADGAASDGVRGDGAEAAAAELTWGAAPLRVRLTAPGATVTREIPGEARVCWPVKLPGRGAHEVSWELTVSDPGAVVVAAADGHGHPWAAVRADADDPRLPRLLARSVSDAAALRMATARAPQDVFLAAGAPWFFTLFGRDSIWAARLLLPFGWQLAAGTLRALAAFQGRRVDPATAEAPGKIPHELRTARPGAGDGGLPPLYYGTIDATPLWICLLHDAWRWGMPAAQVRALLPSLRAALACLRDHGDADGDGFLEYLDESGHGLANQGWKDSGDSVRFADGRIASPPVALCEVQGYACEAARHGADLLDAFGEPGAPEWRAWAGRMASAFRSAFWVSDPAGPYPAIALDGGKRPVDSLTSNIGHLLGTGLLTAAEESQVAARLAGPELDSGFGLRTMSAASGGYSPLSYHCGSVWSHDTAIVTWGLARAGHAAAAAALGDGLLEAAASFGWRLPELFSGEARSRQPWPSPYPASCRPQAWAAAAAGALVQAMLGLEVDVPAGAVRLSPPRPADGGWAGRLRVDGLVAGTETFTAGVDADGKGYLRGLGLERLA
jgi:glycogen debranching enzyme